MKLRKSLLLMLPILSIPTFAQETTLLWGDTHLHTALSPDAYVQRNTTAMPDDAYRFAKGAPVIDANTRAKLQIETPLDFLIVADHAEYLGVTKMIFEGDDRLDSSEIGQRFKKMIEEGKGREVFFELVQSVNNNTPIEELVTLDLRNSVWHEIVDAAERHNDPGNFTAIIGWEWSSLPNGQNLHRIIFMPEGGDIAKQFTPITSFDTDIETEFWDWLEKTSKETGASFVAIPHNGNISGGLMYPLNDRYGNPIDKTYANKRMRWEPVMETTQIKGDSETHPALSPDDEFADFETYENLIRTNDGEEIDIDSLRAGSYTREGLKRGLEFKESIGANPFKYGLIGATDSHTGYATVEENNYWGKFSIDSNPDNKNFEVAPGGTGWDMSASGLSGVWATENTRQSITDAFIRKEVYGTSGPRIQLRFFGGWDFKSNDANETELAKVGYKKGVPMGGDLVNAPKNRAPSFLIQAVKDPKSANLDRVQVIKAWVDSSGQSHEKVFDVAWSDDRKPNGKGKLPAVGNTVDLSTGLYTDDIGDVELTTVWSDPNFDAGQNAFYYARVLEVPTPRNSTLDAIALDIDPKETGHSITIQERAYSSPIWYSPK
ncbi:DUF3604 domain-containing protein [Vibrio kyushuensis]|uniref:DUF3604 domain-containing protein n=1 Tax=Vibrio kyushuensis TaxID=2910249 RepID=UPI003D1175F6